MRLTRTTAKNWSVVVAMGLVCLLMTPGCESMIEGIGDSLTHDSDVSRYERHGFSHENAERRVFEDNYFDHMDDP